jgi:hypothetical protein
MADVQSSIKKKTSKDFMKTVATIAGSEETLEKIA